MSNLPDGFIYQPEFISDSEEQRLLDAICKLDLKPFEMQGMMSKRRVGHYGVLYDYNRWSVRPGPSIPEVMLPVREQLASAMAIEPEALVEALVTEYPAGAGIGWHRDAPMFGIVVAVSLAGRCRFRFQRGKGTDRETREVEVLPRSMYAITGEARSQWQHSIPATKELRYSITFRTVRSRSKSSRVGDTQAEPAPDTSSQDR